MGFLGAIQPPRQLALDVEGLYPFVKSEVSDLGKHAKSLHGNCLGRYVVFYHRAERKVPLLRLRRRNHADRVHLGAFPSSPNSHLLEGSWEIVSRK